MFKNVKNYVSDFFEAIFYEGPIAMTPEQENYEKVMQEREELFNNTVNGLLTEIESVCRNQNSIETGSFGFHNVSPILFEDSFYEKVVNHLQALGYKCRMNFNYNNGKLESSLTIRW